MRRMVVALALLAAGCSKQMPDEAPSENSTVAAAPEMRATLTPGVALTYAYTFRLPAGRVADTQEKHAMQCEALGPQRCRIVGMSYHVVQKRWAQGTLGMKLAPDLARRFGKQGVATAIEEGGMLSDAEITSVEAGATVAAADRDEASMNAEQAQISGMLNKPHLGDNERVQLQSRQAALADAKRTAANSRADAAALLASTPVTFTYQSGVIDTGFRDGPFVATLKDGWANVVDGSLIILMFVITVFPWAIAAIVLFWLWRRFSYLWQPHRPDKE